MSEHIAIESSEIRAQLGDLSNAASALNGQGRNVEVTGRVPSMAAFLETYDKMLQLILDYKNLLSKEASNINTSITIIQQREEEVARSIQ